jgi:CheY-like chemotaxis protein
VTKRVLAIVDDLFFRVKIEAAARQAGVAVQFAGPLATSGEDVDLILLDLNHHGADVLALLPRLPGSKVIGFVSHVQTDLRRAAAAAGCGRVMARSAFSDQLVRILQGAEDAESSAGIE